MTAETQKPAADKSAKTLTGTVVSSKMNKTISVAVERLVKHPTYGKYGGARPSCSRTTRTTSAARATRVAIAECRPLSRHKAWTLVRVVERAPAE